MEFKKEIVIFLENNAKKYAKVVIKVEEDGVYNILYTYVSDEYRNRGIAEELVKEALKFINQHNGKVKAGCSYAYKYLEENNIEMVK